MAGRTSRLLSRLRELGYEVYHWFEEGSRPDTVDVRFADLVPCLSSTPVGSARLYRHQLKAFEALRAGRNVVLTAKTGSGKTEAWAVAALAEGWRVLAVYPTLALSADQIRRLEAYYRACGMEGAVVRVDRPSLSRRGGLDVSSARVVVTNPAFLLADLKRYAVSASRSYLAPFLERADLIVVDELDFYGPRSAHLVLAMLELISRHVASEPPRVAVLSATLGNPDELARYLTEINGRPSVTIEGKPFRSDNLTMLVLAKNASVLRDYILSHADVIASKARWIVEVAENEEEFRDHLYEVYEALEAMGLRPPRPSLDPVEVLAEIVREPGEGVTLVFARSVKSAERIYRSLLDALPPELHGRVAIHHHLVPKRVREEVEEAARRGRVKLIVTVRTLAQGIDIGTVNRVVHVGLPIDLREFLQREGRKGRRPGMLSETVIIPAGVWDRRLLEAGAKALRRWLSLPLEKLYVNPGNRYAFLFRAMWRLVAGVGLTDEEKKVLLDLGLAKRSVDVLGGERLEVTEKGRKLWSEIGFYEHGPPYGYRKVVAGRGGVTRAAEEEVSLRDAVEHYQPGSYDPVTEMIVVDVDPKRLRIYEEDVGEAARSYDWLSKAVARYEDIKRAWGERPSLEDDLRYGRIYTTVVMRVEAPLNGFGPLIEEPLQVKWIVESRRPKLYTRGGVVRVYREVASIELEAPVRGRYRDYTYGVLVEAPGFLDTHSVWLGFLALQVALRMHPSYAIPLTLLRGRVLSLGPVKLLHVWEYEAAGLLERLDWAEVAKRVGEVEADELFSVLTAALDPEAGVRVLRGEVPVNQLLELARTVAEAIAGVRTVEAGGLRVRIPRRNRSHGIASMVVLAEADEGYRVVFDFFDGEGHRVVESSGRSLGFREAAELAQRVLAVIDSLVSERFRIYYYGKEQYVLLRRFASTYLASMAITDLEKKGLLIDASTVAAAKGLKGLSEVLGLRELRRMAEHTGFKSGEELKEAAARLAEAVYDLVLAAEKGAVESRAEEAVNAKEA